MKQTLSSTANNRRRRVLTALAALTLSISLLISGCGDKNTSSEASQEASSAIVSSQEAEASVSSEVSSETSSAAESSKAESKEESKAESKAESKTESKAESKANSQEAASQPASTQTVTTTQEDTAPESKTESKAEEANGQYHAGQTITVDVKFGNIKMNGSPAKIGAYDYWITYDDSALEYVSAEEMTTSDMKVINDKESGSIKIAHIAALGFDDDFSGEKKPTYRLTFKVKKDTSDLGLTGECPSLTAVSMDGKDLLTLISKQHPADTYSEMTINAE